MAVGWKRVGRSGWVAAAVFASGAIAACEGINWDDIRGIVEGAKAHGASACSPPAVTADLQAVFAVGTNDVWAVGNAGTVLHYDGCWRAEAPVTGVNLDSVWASADGTVWVGGDDATTLLRSGGAWSVVKTPGVLAVRGIWKTATDVWAAEEDGIYRWDGAAWQLAHANTTPGTYLGIWAAAPADVWVVGFGKEADGDAGALRVHWDGSAWTESFTCNPEGNRFASGGWSGVLRDVTGTGSDAVWAAGECESGASFVPEALVEHGIGGSWSGVTLPGGLGDYRPLKAIWAGTDSDVWAASAAASVSGHVPTVLHFDGTTWTASGDPSTAGVSDIAGTGPTDVWAVGLRGKRLHFDGATWTASP